MRKISSDRHSPAVQLQTSSNSEGSTTVIRGASDSAPIHIYVSSNAPNAQSSPIVEIVSRHIPSDNKQHQGQGRVQGLTSVKVVKNSQDNYHASPLIGSSSSANSSDGGVSSSYHTSCDLTPTTPTNSTAASLADSGVFASDVDQDIPPIMNLPTTVQISAPRPGPKPKPARKTSYLSAVNAPRGRLKEFGYFQCSIICIRMRIMQ